MYSNILSYQEAKEQVKSMKFRTLVEYKDWVKTNNFQELFPINPRVTYKEFEGGAEFLGWTKEEYDTNVKLSRAEKVDYSEIGKKVSARFAERRIERAKQTPVVQVTQPKTEKAYISPEEMVKFFIKEDVDIKTIINFLSEYSHPKDVYQIFLDYLKSKLPVKI